MQRRASVLIADDHPLVSHGLRELLRSTYTVVGTVGDGREVHDAVERLKPDVLLLDLSMPQMDGMEVLFLLREKAPETKVVVLSGFGRDRLAPLALELGAAQYVEKGVDGPRLRRVVLAVHEDTPAPRAA